MWTWLKNVFKILSDKLSYKNEEVRIAYLVLLRYLDSRWITDFHLSKISKHAHKFENF